MGVSFPSWHHVGCLLDQLLFQRQNGILTTQAFNDYLQRPHGAPLKNFDCSFRCHAKCDASFILIVHSFFADLLHSVLLCCALNQSKPVQTHLVWGFFACLCYIMLYRYAPLWFILKSWWTLCSNHLPNREGREAGGFHRWKQDIPVHIYCSWKMRFLTFFGSVLIEINKSQPFHLTDSTLHPGGVKSYPSPSSPGHTVGQTWRLIISCLRIWFPFLWLISIYWPGKKRGKRAFETHWWLWRRENPWKSWEPNLRKLTTYSHSYRWARALRSVFVSFESLHTSRTETDGFRGSAYLPRLAMLKHRFLSCLCISECPVCTKPLSVSKAKVQNVDKCWLWDQHSTYGGDFAICCNVLKGFASSCNIHLNGCINLPTSGVAVATEVHINILLAPHARLCQQTV